ncbi:MAG TPA: S24 family peptidase [Pyrinomonadaceae bacterium]|jgi:SOS-response transcriptional repressor LexA
MKNNPKKESEKQIDFNLIRSQNIFPEKGRMIEIPDYGEIGAGKVVPFSKERKKIKVPKPSNAHDGDILFAHRVSGDSLNNLTDPDKNIRNGDSLICKANCELREITPDKICIVFISQTCESLAKHVILNGDYVILRSTNPHYPDRRFPADVVEIKGLVLGYKRMF